jgi:hypothetical protein
MSASATTSIVGPDGNTTTALGAQEWLKSAHTGDMATPTGVRSGVVRVTELFMNWG